MSEHNVEVIQKMYDAFAKGDVASVLEAMDPQIVWNSADNFPYADGNPYVGPTNVAKGVFQRLADEWEGWKLEIEQLLDADDVVVATGRYHAVNKKTGTEIDAQFAHLWWLRHGKPVRYQQYADTAQIAAAVG